MNIVILRTNTGNFGKIGTYNVQEVGLAKALIRKGHNVNVLYLNRATKEIIKDEHYDFVYYIPHISFGLHGIFNINILSKFSPSLLIMWTDNQLSTRSVINWCKNNGTRIICYFGGVLSTIDEFFHKLYTKLIFTWNKPAYRYSINIAKTNEVGAEMEKMGIPFSGVLPIGLDMSLMSTMMNLNVEERASLGFSSKDKVVLFVGRIEAEKKPFMAIDILKRLCQIDRSFRLVLIGDGSLSSELEMYIKQSGIADRVTYIKRVEYANIYRYMVSSDCLINLCDIEIFGMTILEGMYYGIPVVAKSAPGPNDIIDDGTDGYLCYSDDLTQWTDLICKAMKSRKKLSLKSRQKIEDCYSWDKRADDFLHLVDE